MAMYHLNVGFVSRSSGRSSVQSAAYITGSQLHESRRDLKVNYKNCHSDITFTTTLVPEHTPESFKAVTVWDTLENFEDSYAKERYKNLEAREKYLNSAQTAMTLVVALPRELSIEVAQELVTEFATTRFVSRGLIVTLAIHDDEGNPHAHLQISRRAVNEKGEINWTKDREICTKKALIETRKLWADLTNQYLEREGFSERITHKSFADLGVQLEPTQHRGWVSDKLADMGIKSRIVTQNQETFDKNRQALLDNPALILNELTHTKATFSQVDLLKAVQKRIGDDTKLVAGVFEMALSGAIVVGERLDGQIRYTSPHYKATEERALQMSQNLLEKKSVVPSTAFTDNSQLILDNQYNWLSAEQKEAVKGLSQGHNLAVLIGRAGAGKTTTLKALCEIYKSQGKQVIGTSLAALSAKNLATEANITSSTLHSLIYKWDRYRDAQAKFLSFNSIMSEGLFKQLDWYKDLKSFEKFQLSKDHVVIVDEAGMIGARQWGELLNYVTEAGAQIIAVGDDNQFKAIEAGDFFRDLKEQAQIKRSLYQLDQIKRQKPAWMREASVQLAELNVSEALSAYEQRGHITISDANHLSLDIAKLYLEKSTPDKQGLILAFTNKQVNEINQMVRAQLKAKDLLGQDVIKVGEKTYALGDKIIFLANHKTAVKILQDKGVTRELTKEGIKNGTVGTLIKVNPNHSLEVALGNGKIAHFNPKAYDKISRGYAVTAHKAQGQTVDFTIVRASKHMGAQALYVSLTRHREDVQLFYDKSEFKSFKALVSYFSHVEYKDLVKDYTIKPEHEANWQRVQEYQLAILDSAAILKEGNHTGTTDWRAYNQIKADQISLGKEILKDFNAHKLYLEQAGLSQEMLEISTGYKKRPLSLMEEKAKLTVELYGETALLTRSLYKNIKTTSPIKLTQHTDYNKWQDLRAERDYLAQVILENYPLHQQFVNEYSKAFGITKKTLQNQVNYRTQKENSLYSPLVDLHTSLPPIQLKEKAIETLDNNFTHNQTMELEAKNQSYQEKSFQGKNLTSAEINQQLKQNIKNLSFKLLGKPNFQTAKEWRYGKKGSISIQINGVKQGVYANFETGEYGNDLTLIQSQLNLDKKAAFKWAQNWLGLESHSLGNLQEKEISIRKTILPTYLSSNSNGFNKDWKVIFPAIQEAVDLNTEKQLSYIIKDKIEVNRFVYKDAAHNVLGYVVRLEDKDGHKITPTLTYCQNKEGIKQWRWQGFGDNRPLYGLEQLAQKPNAPVLIVEGEKTCEAAKNLFPEMAVITWNGGVGSVNKTDWSVLKEREVIIWPDHDKAGINAASKIAEILIEQGHEKVKIVDLPSHLPHKWNLADKMPEGIEVKSLLVNTFTHEKALPSQEVSFGFPNFTYQDMEQVCYKYHLSSMDKQELAPFITFVANETYTELEDWLKITNQTMEDKKIEAQALLTGIYSHWAYSMLTVHKEKPNALKEALEIGAIAAHLKINNLNVDNRDIIFKAIDINKNNDLAIKQKLQNGAFSPLSPVKQEALLKANSRCQSLTGKDIPHTAMVHFVPQMEIHSRNIDENNPRMAQSIMEQMRKDYANEKNLSKTINPTETHQQQLQKQEKLQKALQESQKLTLQKEQIRQLRGKDSMRLEQ